MFKIIGDLIRRKQTGAPMRDVSAMTGGLTKPAIHVIVQEEGSLSHFGGSPHLPAEITWPHRNENRLTFLARISLSEVHRTAIIDWLPDSGALLFFYDIEQQPWGFDPKDRGAWAVLHVPDLAGPVASANPSEDSPLPFKSIGFRAMNSFPSYERDEVASLGFTNGEADKYAEISDLPYQRKPKHQISGYPAPVQGDSMELESQLVSNGLYCGDSTGYNDPRAQSLQSEAHRWRRCP
jgi:hypothetical protein